MGHAACTYGQCGSVDEQLAAVRCSPTGLFYGGIPLESPRFDEVDHGRSMERPDTDLSV